MHKILVTGGAGYIGSHTVLDLLEHGYEVICADNGINSDTHNLEAVQKMTGKSVAFYPIDLCDAEATQQLFQEHPDIDGIIHFAALKAVGESVEKPLLYFKNNIESLLNVLDGALRYKVKSFIFSSSCTVYGNTEICPVNESTPLQEASSPYGRTKQMGEQILTDTLKNQKHLQCILLRYFNPAGAHVSGLMGEAPVNPPLNLVPVITEVAIGKREKMTVYGTDYPTRDGSCIRDYIHVMDLARAHTLAMRHVLSGAQKEVTDIFNLGIGEGLTVLEIIEAFERNTGIKLHYELGPRRPGDVVAIYSDYNKASRILGWQPQYDVNDIVTTAWEWEKNRQKDFS